MDIEIGSNLYKNFNGTIEVEGVPQLQVSRHPSTGALLVNFALFDSNGRMLAKVVDSTLMFNERRAYELAKTDKRLTMKEVDSGRSGRLAGSGRVLYDERPSPTSHSDGVEGRETAQARADTRHSGRRGLYWLGTAVGSPSTIGVTSKAPFFISTEAVFPSRSSPLTNNLAIGVSSSC